MLETEWNVGNYFTIGHYMQALERCAIISPDEHWKYIIEVVNDCSIEKRIMGHK